ncbi:MAG: phytoene/squalene synthase family protein [Planctomycetaceae bacterium]
MTVHLVDSHRFCRQVTRRTAANFGYAFWALPNDQRQAMNVLYAFMRLTDDLGDDPDLDPATRAQSLIQWRHDLHAAFLGHYGRGPHWPALADVARRYEIPCRLLEEVIDGVEMDLNPRDFPAFSDLQNYCYHVAGTVGLCCIRIWGCHEARAEQPAIDCGLAFQLTNILRDLAEDADMGRVYLPQEDLHQFGYPAQELKQRRITPEFMNLMAFETERAWSYYRRAESLKEFLPPAGRRVLGAMQEIYGGLLTEIERRNFDVFSRRVRLPAWRKLWITGKSLWR